MSDTNPTYSDPSDPWKDFYSSEYGQNQLASGIPAYQQGFLSQDPSYANYWSMYGPFPVNGSDADKMTWMQKAAIGGGQEASSQQAAKENSAFTTENAGFLLAALPALAMVGGAGLAGSGDIGGVGDLAGGLSSADVAGGMVPEFGTNAAYDAAMGTGASGFGYGSPESLVGTEGAESILGNIPAPTSIEEEIARLGGTPDALPIAPTEGLPSLPPGTKSVVDQLVKALTGDSTGSKSGMSAFGQGAIPASAGYVRKSRPLIEQPAFLGDQGQQPLGSAEDTAFNEAVAGRGEDISTRAKQMAAQLRGRPGFFGIKG